MTMPDKISGWAALIVTVALAGISVLAAVSFADNAASAGERLPRPRCTPR